MRMKTSVIAGVLIAVLLTAIPALADAPAEGVVHEGASVPGVALGDNRGTVLASYGQPASCQDRDYSDGRVGVDSICRFRVEGTYLRVTVNFYAPDGGPADGSTSDEAFSVTWDPGVTGWVTTAGINTEIAQDDPDAVLAAYPDAEVTYWYDGTFVAHVVDWQQGISIRRQWEFYCGCAVATMTIFYPQDPPPPPEPIEYVYVDEINLSVEKTRGKRQITADVLVLNRQDLPAEGAAVSATWHLPDGSEQAVQGEVGSSGTVTFTLSGKLKKGTYYLFIDEVALADHLWRPGGLRHASIEVT